MMALPTERSVGYGRKFPADGDNAGSPVAPVARSGCVQHPYSGCYRVSTQKKNIRTRRAVAWRVVNTQKTRTDVRGDHAHLEGHDV